MAKRQIGCALWSLAIPDTVHSLEAAARLGFESVQFTFCQDADLEPANLRRIEQAIDQTGLDVPAGMVGFPGEDWQSIATIRRTGGLVDPATFPERLERCRRWAGAMATLGIDHVTTHIGFVPEAADPRYAGVLDRISRAADAFKAAGMTMGLETGQESGAALRKVLEDLGRDDVSVNYDPANFILYGSDDPVVAARELGPRTSMAHMKDGVPSARPGEDWGEEVPVGKGSVDFPCVLAALADGGFRGTLILEREAGNDRAGDLTAGRRFLEDLLRRLPG